VEPGENWAETGRMVANEASGMTSKMDGCRFGKLGGGLIVVPVRACLHQNVAPSPASTFAHRNTNTF